MTPSQCRMARAGLLWTLRDLSEKSGVSVATITRFEADDGQKRRTNRTNLTALQRAFEASGAVFVEDNDGFIGVKVKKYSNKFADEKSEDDAARGYYPLPYYVNVVG